MQLIILLLQISLIFAIPVQKLVDTSESYSVLIEKPYHPLNLEKVSFVKEFLITFDTNVKSFHNLHTSRPIKIDKDLNNVVERNGKIGLTKDGKLQLFHHDVKTHDDETDDDMEINFSIQNGYLYINGLSDISICLQNKSNEFIYSIFASRYLHKESINNNCQLGKLDGFRLKLIDESGVIAQDYESPGFLYNFGNIVHI